MSVTAQTPLVERYTRYVTIKPGRAARLLADLDKRLETGRGDEYERAQQRALLTAFEKTERCCTAQLARACKEMG